MTTSEQCRLVFPCRLEWRADGYYLVDGDGFAFAMMTFGTQNAEFVVRACNAHDELLEVCKCILSSAKLVPCKDGGKDATEGDPGSMIAGKWRVESSIDGWIARLRDVIESIEGK